MGRLLIWCSSGDSNPGEACRWRGLLRSDPLRVAPLKKRFAFWCPGFDPNQNEISSRPGWADCLFGAPAGIRTPAKPAAGAACFAAIRSAQKMLRILVSGVRSAKQEKTATPKGGGCFLVLQRGFEPRRSLPLTRPASQRSAPRCSAQKTLRVLVSGVRSKSE